MFSRDGKEGEGRLQGNHNQHPLNVLTYGSVVYQIIITNHNQHHPPVLMCVHVQQRPVGLPVRRGMEGCMKLESTSVCVHARAQQLRRVIMPV